MKVKAFRLISSRDHCQRSSPLWISDTPQVGFEPAQSLNTGLVEWSCAVVITTTPWPHNQFQVILLQTKRVEFSIEFLIFSLKSITIEFKSIKMFFVTLDVVKFAYFYTVNQWEFCIDLIFNRCYGQLPAYPTFT